MLGYLQHTALQLLTLHNLLTLGLGTMDASVQRLHARYSLSGPFIDFHIFGQLNCCTPTDARTNTADWFCLASSISAMEGFI